MSQEEQTQDVAEITTVEDLPLTSAEVEQTKGGSLIGGQLWGEGKQVKIDFCQ